MVKSQELPIDKKVRINHHLCSIFLLVVFSTRHLYSSSCSKLNLKSHFCLRCPRFLLHYTREQESLVDHSTPQLPNVFHPYSASSPIPQKSRNLKMHAFATPQTPSHTPTFKRLHMTTPINSNPVRPSQDVVSRNESAAPGQSRTSSVVNLTPSPKIIRKGLQTPPIRKELKADVSKMEKLPTINQSSKRMTASASRYNQLAKYSARHLQDNSQCASRMVSYIYNLVQLDRMLFLL